MPTTFPENEVQVLRRYLPLSGGLRDKLQRVKSELARTRVDHILTPDKFAQISDPLTPSQRLKQNRAIEINSTRSHFLAVLKTAPLGEQDKPQAVTDLDTITDDLLRHETLALDDLNNLDKANPIPNLELDRPTIELASTVDSAIFWTITVETVVDHGHPKQIRTKEENALPGYAAARLEPAEIDLLLSLLSFLSGTSERTFRLGLLRGEALFAQGMYREAIDAYKKVRQRLLSVATDEEITARRKFLALRQGFAGLRLGDSLFRNPDESDPGDIRKAYDDAVTVVTSSAISPENPLRQQIEQYAEIQKAKLDAGLNFLGYRDSYVPILRPATLQALAERRINAATQAVNLFRSFKTEADQLDDKLAELDFQKQVKEKELEIADEQIGKAMDQVAKADDQIDKINGQFHSLEVDLGVAIGGSLLQGAAAGLLAGQPKAGIGIKTGTNIPGVAGAFSGLGSAVAGYLARKHDLEFQKKIAEKERGIAQREVRIAELGKEITQATMDFLGDRFRRVQKRELNPDVYYAAAEGFRALAERHLDAAILWAYLFERAVVFLRLVPDRDSHTIQLDYGSGLESLLTAPARLEKDLNDVIDQNLPITKFQFLAETYSLRSLYPLEFNQFLQTGRMDFTISLYELNKRRPGVYRQRIKRVQVELQFPPPSGFTGRIRHRGSFLLRDKDTTPEPGAGKFMPTGEQLEEAFAALGAGAAQGVSIDGVMPFLLDVDTIELSPDQPPPDLNDPAPEALAPIEGYGPAGDWTLEVEHVDLRFISDALLHITYIIPESDEPLSDRVKGLIAKFEEEELVKGDALDLISPFSLRQRFSETLAQLGSGQAQFAVARNDFPAGITGLKLKTIVVQALDSGRKGVKGVALEISKPGTDPEFRLERSTRADGFSEDLATPIPFRPREQRFDLEGTYALRLPSPGQLSVVDDLLVFFVYEFREI